MTGVNPVSPELHTDSEIDKDLCRHTYVQTHTPLRFPAAVVSKYQQMSGPEIKTKRRQGMRPLRCGRGIPLEYHSSYTHTHKPSSHTCTHAFFLFFSFLSFLFFFFERDPDAHRQSYPGFYWPKQPDGAQKMNNIPEPLSRSYYDICLP